MKILWVVNILIGPISEKITGKTNGGLWMGALLSELKSRKDVEIVVATAYKIKNPVMAEEDGVKYYAIPNDYTINYNENRKKNLLAWKGLIESEKPDVIHIFGTEFAHGLCALKVKGDIPAVIFIQGLMSAISKFYLAGIPYKTAKRTKTFRDFVRQDDILSQQKKFFKAAKKEERMLRLSQGIISENEWCNANVKAVKPDVKIYYCPLSINKVFAEKKWDIKSAGKHSVICTASGYTVKGLHVLLRAISILKKIYPDVKLYVPGEPQVCGKGLKAFIRKNGYVRYVENLIKSFDLKDNIVWLGRLTQERLAEEYTKRHVFVMPSAIENHSSSLKEAMTVGMPCISSYVGGVSEYLKDGENGLLYRFEEYGVLALLISKVFENDDLAEKLSVAARESMQKLHDGKEVDRMIAIYEDVFNGDKLC